MYVDLTHLSKCVRRERQVLPSVDHTLAQLSNGKVFSKVDANSGFWQIELYKQSVLLNNIYKHLLVGSALIDYLLAFHLLLLLSYSNNICRQLLKV